MLVGSITIEVDNVMLAFARLDVALSPTGLTTFLDTKVDPYLRARAAARFASEGDDAVGAWQALTPTTEHFRETEGFPSSHPINRRTGELEAYIIGEDALVTPMGAGANLQLPGRAATGYLAEKFKTAQQGKASPRTPARPVLGLGARDRTEIMAMLMFFIGEAMVG